MSVEQPSIANHRESDFSYMLNEQRSRRGDQTIARHEFAAPLWRWSVNFPPMHSAQFMQWKVWFDQIQFSKPFLAYDPEIPFPQAYADGELGFSGIGSLTVLAGNSVRLNGLPTGFVLSKGDHVECRLGNERQLLRVKEISETTPTSATIITAGPRIITGIFGAGSVYNLIKPACNMVLTEWNPAPRQAAPTGLSFKALQVPRLS